ncbi:hypothetical protein KIPB_011106 [Kipferlia bialata]|uniref:Uncharacterized protein n=1 Tax=Kipferlia bialata TaxID=797122 RepID=A0A9K3D7R6_9EUKA|nr:hypothetical protein KIPB_011106 [Kipferlia bialata]|eukprot:g11106.t1
MCQIACYTMHVSWLTLTPLHPVAHKPTQGLLHQYNSLARQQGKRGYIRRLQGLYKPCRAILTCATRFMTPHTRALSP